MHIVFIGPPGVGKGTQANMLMEKYAVSKISTGDLLRDSIKNGSSLGNQAKGFMERGELVPDQLVLGLVQEKILSAQPGSKPFIFDGFPRNISQAIELDKIMVNNNSKINLVVDFTMDEEERIARLSGRRMCPKCQRTYHILFSKPKKDNFCDLCGVQLVQRSDDNESVIRQRSTVYWEHTRPLLDYYNNKHILSNVNASLSIDDVFGKLEKLIAPLLKV